MFLQLRLLSFRPLNFNSPHHAGFEGKYIRRTGYPKAHKTVFRFHCASVVAPIKNSFVLQVLQYLLLNIALFEHGVHQVSILHSKPSQVVTHTLQESVVNRRELVLLAQQKLYGPAQQALLLLLRMYHAGVAHLTKRRSI